MLLTDKMQITKMCLQLKHETMLCVSIGNVFVMTSPFCHYRGVTLDRLLMLDFQPIKTACVWEWHMVVPLPTYLSEC